MIDRGAAVKAVDGYLENEMTFTNPQDASLAFAQLKQPTRNARIEKRPRVLPHPIAGASYYVLVFDYPEGAYFWI